MDKGGHFHRCDFQVHSPRDRQWKGEGAVSDDDRRAYSIAFIAACRERGLHAVAITDHHDMAFAAYVRAAALEETDASGAPVPESERIAVFPGMELTLAVPCQALVLFDADFPRDLFGLAMTALAITPAPDADARTADTQRLNINSLELLQAELDRHSYLKGRYIVLPNVSEGGSSTLLRSGHSAHYRNMPCIGGYVDGDISQHGVGNARILSGNDSQYGSKALGLFQTSDNRQRDFAELGTSSTWVKWAAPTAEALRQACLARASRLAQIEPSMPASSVTAIDVSNSAFLGPIYLEFNSQYNALIGGRGTGKSTILEYVRWALCDDSSSLDDDGLPSDQARRRKLIEQTLVPVGATVQVHLLINGVPHVVRRHSADGQISLKIGSAGFETCKETDVRALLPVQAYSQKQLSSVGVRVDELRRFIQAPARQALDDIRAEVIEKGNNLRAIYSNLRSKRQLEREVELGERELKSIDEQSMGMRNELVGVDDADRHVLDNQPLIEREFDIVSGWRGDLDRAKSAITEATRVLATIPTVGEASQLEKLVNGPSLERMGAAIRAQAELARKGVAESLSAIDAVLDSHSSFGVEAASWKGEYATFQASYALAKSRSSAHAVKLAQLDQLEKRARAVRERLKSRKDELAAEGAPEVELANVRDQWCDLHEHRSEILEAQCRLLTLNSDGYIRATLVRGGAAEIFQDRLRAILTGSSITKAKTDRLWEPVASSESPVRGLQRVLDELEGLSLYGLEGAEGALPPTPFLRAAGLTDKELVKAASKLSTDAWLDLCIIPLDDQPQFEYRLREGQYIPFADASAGQQATALLWALLNQSGPPLLIDQPEDDLDNQIVLRVVEQIWKAKERRQLIFTSHNANVVVNGDADLVICCDYRVAGEQAGGRIKLEGAIDLPNVRDEIATVMEGGKAAFRLRKDKYGF